MFAISSLRMTRNHPITRVLVAVDFSDHSLAAARLAVSIAGAAGAEVAFYNVAQRSDHVSIPLAAAEEIARDVTKSATARLQKLASDIDQGALDGQIRLVVRDGDPARSLLGFATEWEADFIVMGSRGADSVDRDWLGSVAVRVTREARCPVLTTRADHAERFPADGRFGHVMVAIDYSKFSKPAVELAASLAAPHTTIEMIHIFVAPEQAIDTARTVELQRLEELAHEIDLAPVKVALPSELGPLAGQLVDYAKNSKTDAIIVGAHGREDSAAHLGSVASRLLLCSPVPVIVLPDSH